jgi:hypothetical protein
MRRMLSLPSKRCAIGACIAVGSLLSNAPALAQTGTGTGTGTGTKTAPSKPDAKKEPTKPAGQSDPKTAAETQGPKKDVPVDAEKTDDKEKEEKESSRAVFVSGDLAFARVDLGGISDNLSFDKPSANGLLYGLAAGLRFRDLRIGARWRVHSTTEFDMWSVGGSIGYGLPMRPLSPVFTAIVGYVWDQKIERGVFSSSLPNGTVLAPDVDLNGLLVGLDLNASYWLSTFARIGAFIGTDFMFLSRQKAALPTSIFPITDEFKNKPLYTESGSSIAYTLNIGLRGAFDVGF